VKLISSSNLIEPRTIWDQRFSRAVVNRHNYEPWLEPWWSLFETSKDVPILDLDCGRGYDSLYLTARGLRVIAADFSREALKAACRTAVGITSQVQIDLRQGLPFRAATFQVIVANLSLYYFPRRQTAQIINGVRDCLRSGGYLLARFNSTGDVQYGA
jgi:SAM-dependent methyltransferase